MHQFLSIKNRVPLQKALSLAITFSFLLTPVYAASGSTSNGLTDSNMSRLSDFEVSIYGAARKQLSNDARLDELELRLFGATKNGSDTARLQAISALMPSQTASQSTGLAMRAPSLDSLPVQAAPFRDLPDEGPDSSQALSAALGLYSAGRTAEAQKALNDILNTDPKSFDALYNLGVIAESSGNLDQALYYYKRAQTINSRDSEVNKAITALSRKVQDNQKAMSDRAAGDKQAKLKAMVQDASAMYRAKNYDGAISRLTQVSYEAPRDADVQFALAQAYRAKGDLNGARHFMSQAASLAPQNKSYASALAELNSAGSQSVAQNGYSSQPSYAPAPAVASQGGGQITPFAGSKADEFASGNGGGSQFGSASYLGGGSSTRLKRAVTYGVAGAAGAALFSAFAPSYNGRSRASNMSGAALKGGLLGSFLGFTLGR